MGIGLDLFWNLLSCAMSLRLVGEDQKRHHQMIHSYEPSARQGCGIAVPFGLLVPQTCLLCLRYFDRSQYLIPAIANEIQQAALLH